jgi:hypothetical protein
MVILNLIDPLKLISKVQTVASFAGKFMVNFCTGGSTYLSSTNCSKTDKKCS